MSKPVYDASTKSKVRIENGAVIATAPTIVHVPAYFENRKLLTLSDKAEVIGAFNIIVDGSYFVIISPLIYTLPFKSFQMESVDDEPYYALAFEKGDTIIQSLTVAKNALLTTEILTYLLLRAQIPYYITSDMALVMVNGADQYGGINLDSNSALMELILSLSQRDSEDKDILFRHSTSKVAQFVPLTDVNFGTFSNFSRLLNGYQSSGMVTSLVNDEPTRPSRVETILRR